MINKSALLILPVLAVVLVSGCVGPSGPGVATGAGLVITDWEPDFSQVNSNEKVRVQLRAQNQGQVRAENIEAEITGIDITEWGTLMGFSAKKQLGSAMYADPETGTPGAVLTATWDLEAPKLSKGVDFTYEPIVKLAYDYKTTAQKPITLVDIDELRNIMQQGKSLPSEPTTYSAGPLAVEIRTGDYVKTSDDFGKVYDIFPLYVKVTNTQWEQGGTVTQKGVMFPTGEVSYPVEMKITPPTGTNFVFSGFGQNCGQNVIMDLWQGKDAEITCELDVTSPPTYREEKLINVELQYRYRTEAATQVRVVGTQTPGGLF